MVYYDDGTILIRSMEASDASIICDEELKQGWHVSEKKYIMRLDDEAAGKSVTLVAEYQGSVAGYNNVYFDTKQGPFANTGFCEIVDFGVLVKYRKRGIGTCLMDAAEEIAKKCADTVYLAVGVHEGYGSAQRMYVKRGYIPDGSGVWYDNKPCVPYESYCNDDDLNLFFSKKLV